MAKVDPYLAQEQQWQKESDARTLAEAEAIRAKPSRLKGAQSAAKKMAKEAEIQAQSMKKVAATKSKTASKTVPKRTASNKGGTATVNSNTKTPYKRK
jgi:hypothetical protein